MNRRLFKAIQLIGCYVELAFLDHNDFKIRIYDQKAVTPKDFGLIKTKGDSVSINPFFLSSCFSIIDSSRAFPIDIPIKASLFCIRFLNTVTR